MMKQEKKARFKVIITVIAAVFVLCAVYYFMPFGKTAPSTADDYQYGADYVKELVNIPVFSQETGYTCPIVSMVIVKNYLGFETTEYEMRSELDVLERTTGFIPNEWLPLAKQVFEPLSYSVTQVNPTSQAEILNVISGSLEKDMPIVIFYAAPDDWNKPHFNTHYAMVYGIDMHNGLVKISNPYGYLEELSFAALYDGLDFSSYEAEPSLHRLARKAGIIKKNNLFVFNESGD